MVMMFVDRKDTYEIRCLIARREDGGGIPRNSDAGLFDYLIGNFRQNKRVFVRPCMVDH